MHKITKHVMPSEEATAVTPCATDPERWFPDEQKPDPYAVAACWSCYFQSGCARRALAEPMPEFGVWGGYRLAPGPGLERSRAQLAIIAGHEMGPAASPGPEIAAALEDIAGIGRHTQARVESVATVDNRYAAVDITAALVDLDDWREPTAADLVAAAADEMAALDYPFSAEDLIDAHGQILLPLDGWGSAPLPAPASRRRTVSTRCGATAVGKRAS